MRKLQRETSVPKPFLIRDLEKEANTTKRQMSIPFRKGELTFALAGNQNCGKTTLFNQLTGSNQHVGNFPG